MSTTRVRIDRDNPAPFPEGRFDPAVVDGTAEAEIAMQQQEVELVRRIDVPHETIRNWEQGKHRSTGADKALLWVLDKAAGDPAFENGAPCAGNILARERA